VQLQPTKEFPLQDKKGAFRLIFVGSKQGRCVADSKTVAAFCLENEIQPVKDRRGFHRREGDLEASLVLHRRSDGATCCVWNLDCPDNENPLVSFGHFDGNEDYSFGHGAFVNAGNSLAMRINGQRKMDHDENLYCLIASHHLDKDENTVENKKRPPWPPRKMLLQGFAFVDNGMSGETDVYDRTIGGLVTALAESPIPWCKA